jgi:hypothetical protein
MPQCTLTQHNNKGEISDLLRQLMTCEQENLPVPDLMIPLLYELVNERERTTLMGQGNSTAICINSE